MNDAIILRITSPILYSKLTSRIHYHEQLTRLSKQDNVHPEERIAKIWGSTLDFPYDEETDKMEAVRVLKQLERGISEQEDAREREEATLPVRYWKEEDGYFFQFHTDTYYATMVTLPTSVEAIQTIDMVKTTKSHDIYHMLIVHDVTVESGQSRPEITSDGVYIHGITPPMQHALTDTFKKASSQSRREQEGINVKELFETEELFTCYYKQWVVNNKMEKSRVKATKTTSTFVYEEVVEVDAWMANLPEVYSFVKGTDDFRTSFLEAIKVAQEKKKEMDKIEAFQREARLKSKTYFI